MASSNNGTFLEGDALMALVRERTQAGQSIRYLPFRGVSMLPMLRQGKDQVELSPLPPRLKKYDLPVYQMPSGKYVMHRVVADKGNYYLCNGDTLYTFERVPHAHMIALVTAFTRNGRRIEVTSSAYRAYCIFWHYTRPLRHLYRRTRAAVGKLLRRLKLRK